LGGRRVERVAELRGCAVAIESSRIYRSVSSFADVLGVDFTTQDTNEMLQTYYRLLLYCRYSSQESRIIA
jgi:hypothetical protein